MVRADGQFVGGRVGFGVGCGVGKLVGNGVGFFVGAGEGNRDGLRVIHDHVGNIVRIVGLVTGNFVDGYLLGVRVGREVGKLLG